MNFKALALVVVLALVGCGQEKQAQEVGSPRIGKSMVTKIECQRQVGSGIRIGQNTVISADHVIRDGLCSVDYGRRYGVRALTITGSSSHHDFAELSASRLRGPIVPTSCEGIQTGQTYWLAGYPGGGNLLVIEAVATDRYIRGVTTSNRYTIDNLRVMQGRAMHGMSGGPVVNSRGQVVGIISAVDASGTDETMVKELRDTWLC